MPTLSINYNIITNSNLISCDLYFKLLHRASYSCASVIRSTMVSMHKFT